MTRLGNSTVTSSARRAAGALLALALSCAPVVALACPICFNVAEGPVTDGVRVAVIVLMGVTVTVLGGFGWFIARFVRRARTLQPSSSSQEPALPNFTPHASSHIPELSQ